MSVWWYNANVWRVTASLKEEETEVKQTKKPTKQNPKQSKQKQKQVVTAVNLGYSLLPQDSQGFFFISLNRAARYCIYTKPPMEL